MSDIDPLAGTAQSINSGLLGCVSDNARPRQRKLHLVPCHGESDLLFSSLALGPRPRNREKTRQKTPECLRTIPFCDMLHSYSGKNGARPRHGAERVLLVKFPRFASYTLVQAVHYANHTSQTQSGG